MDTQSITITLKTTNSAFVDYGTEVARILRAVAARYEAGYNMDDYTLWDINGNPIGTVKEDQAH